MSADTLARTLGEISDRKTVLKRVGALGFGSALFLLGVRPQKAHAQSESDLDLLVTEVTELGGRCFTHGCNLCSGCASECPPGLDCYWCWWGNCHVNPGGGRAHQTLCCEGYATRESNCPTGACPSTCSYYAGTSYAGC